LGTILRGGQVWRRERGGSRGKRGTTSGLAFTHDTLPARVVFGAGAAERIAAEVAALGLDRVLVIASGSAKPVADGRRVPRKTPAGRRQRPATR
jgi:hypothetical protein